MRSASTVLLLYAAAACVPQARPRPVAPRNGPDATLHVSYTGGLLNRSIEAYFRTERWAYVLVGHLGGDGVIRVLYPESPDESALIRGKKTYMTAATPAHYDALPSLYWQNVSAYRTLSALHDSYDGLGHGYVFMIASAQPLWVELLEDGGSWSEWAVDDYPRTSDPRYAVRELADMLTGGRSYTLKFANSMSSTTYTSYAQRSFDCAFLGFQLMSQYLSWSSWYLRGSPLYGYARGCGSFWYDPYYRSRYTAGRYASNPVVVPPNYPEGTGEPAPTLSRPPRRPWSPQEPSRRTTGTSETRATLTRIAPSGESTGRRDPRDRRTSSGRPRGTTTTTTPADAGSARSSRPQRPSDSDRPSTPRGAGTTRDASPRAASPSPARSEPSSSTRSQPPDRSSSPGKSKPDSR